MAATLEQLEADALRLSADERSALAERLVESLAVTASHQQAWQEAAKKRRDEIRSGVVAGIPGPEGSEKVRALLKQ